MAYHFDTEHYVTGRDLIGRTKEKEYLREFFQQAANGQDRNLSLTGMHKIGKTSLVQTVIREFEQEKHPNVYLLNKSMHNAFGFWQFWIPYIIEPLLKMVDLEELRQINDYAAGEVQRIRAYFADVNTKRDLYANDSAAHSTAKTEVEMLLSMLTICDKKIILVLDEFDCAPNVFGHHEEGFSWFRTLLDSAQGLSVLTLSRRSIYYIETGAFGGSTLHGIFTTKGLYGLKNSELDGFYQILSENGIQVERSLQEALFYYAGRSPYYIALLCNLLLESSGVPQTVQELMDYFESHSMKMYESFASIKKLLQEEHLLAAMLQMFLGPRYNLKEEDVSKLIGMGYCKERPTDRDEAAEYIDPFKKNTSDYLTVSDKFIDYLQSVSRDEVEGIWPKLTSTERLMRKVIISEYKKAFRANWKEQISNLLRKVVSEDEWYMYRGFYYNSRRKFIDGRPRNPNLYDYTMLNVVSISSLKEIFLSDWYRFRKYFDSFTEEDLEDMLSQLKDARDPYAHSSPELLTHSEIEEINMICDRLTTDIQKLLAAS